MPTPKIKIVCVLLICEFLWSGWKNRKLASFEILTDACRIFYICGSAWVYTGLCLQVLLPRPSLYVWRRRRWVFALFIGSSTSCMASSLSTSLVVHHFNGDTPQVTKMMSSLIRDFFYFLSNTFHFWQVLTAVSFLKLRRQSPTWKPVRQVGC